MNQYLKDYRKTFCVFLAFFLKISSLEFVFEDNEKSSIKLMVRQLVADTFDDIVSDPVYGALLLKKPFYTYTNPLRYKSILNFQKHCLALYDTTKEQDVSFFYQQIDKGYYKDSHTGICDYIDTKQDGIIKVLDELEFNDILLPDVLALFDNLKIQERKVGILFQKNGSLYDKKWTFQIPFLYQEHNFYLSPYERSLINNQPLYTKREAPKQVEEASAKAGKSSSPIDFFRNHLVSDKIGFSDARFSFSFIEKKYASSFYSAGGFVTVPCAFSLKKGIVGAHLDALKESTPFDLHSDLVDLYVTGKYSQIKQNVFDYGLSVLDRAATILLENPLGNKRHVGIGVHGKLTKNVSESFSLRTQAHIELLLPSLERRFIKVFLNNTELDSIHVSDPVTEEEAALKVAALNVSMQESFFPEGYKMVVFPGLESQASVELKYKKGLWQASIGGQLWHHTQERFLSTPSGNGIVQSRFDVQSCKQEQAFQENIFCSLVRKKNKESSWFFGLNIEKTFLSQSRGKDFMVSLSLNSSL